MQDRGGDASGRGRSPRIWFVGQVGNHVARLAPAGNLWFTVQTGKFVGKLIVKTGRVEERPAPLGRGSLPMRSR